MTKQYHLMTYAVHSFLESNRNELFVDENTTVENFQDNPVNDQKCLDIFKYTLENYNYELSNNQVCNAINLFLEAKKEDVKHKIKL